MADDTDISVVARAQGLLMQELGMSDAESMERLLIESEAAQIPIDEYAANLLTDAGPGD